MAIMKRGSILNGISGTIGGVTFRQYKGKTIVSMLPSRRNTKPTPVQAQQRTRFKQAAEFAKAIMHNPDRRAIYEARLGKKSLYCSLITEYFKLTANPLRLRAFAVKNSPPGIQRKSNKPTPNRPQP